MKNYKEFCNSNPKLPKMESTISAIDIAQRELGSIVNHDPETFDIQPPKTKLISDKTNFDIDLADYLKAPDLNETESLARDGRGSLKPLNEFQRAQVRNTGSFTVDSERFPG